MLVRIFQDFEYLKKLILSKTLRNFTQDVDRAFKQFIFETMNLTDVAPGKRNYVKQAERNLIIPWDDPYPNISETLSEEQQLLLKTLNTLEAKREVERQHRQATERAASVSSTTKSIRFQDEFASDSGNRQNYDTLHSGILKSRSSTKLSGKFKNHQPI